MSLIVLKKHKLKSHQLPRECYRYLTFYDFCNYLQKVEGIISYKFYDGTKIMPLFVLNFIPVLRNRYPVDLLCYRSSIEITIKLANGRTQILQYTGYSTYKIMDILNNPPKPISKPALKTLTASEKLKQVIIANSNHVLIRTDDQLDLIYWPD